MRSILFLFFFINAAGLVAQSGVADRPKIGLVLSGGGAKGLAHIGVIKVLEEAGIRPDYISGTSMGSIVGGLYAIGYDAKRLEKIVLEEDWDFLLTDMVHRKELSMEEKESEGRYIISFPIQGRRINLPTGLVSGHNIHNKLTRLTSTVYYENDFSKLPVPFICIATDIINGEQVILKNGDLADAMRASMAIPTIFSPVELNGRILVDGGVVNNFPVQELKDMGADIIIGVNVGFRYYQKDELNSMLKIMEQTIFMHSELKNDLAESMCDILIKPDIKNYNASDFNKADSLIAIGERTARAMLPQIMELARDLEISNNGNKTRIIPVNTDFPVNLVGIEVAGLENVSLNMVAGRMAMQTPATVTLDEIESSVNKLYSSQFFEHVSYRLKPEQSGVRMQLKVTEKSGSQFRVGAHYDSDFKSNILLNTTFRNLFIPGSRLSLEAGLGGNPKFSGSYFIYTHWQPSVSIGLSTRMKYLDINSYKNGSRLSTFRYRDEKTELILKSDFKNAFTLGSSLQIQNTSLKNRVGLIDYELPDLYLINYRGFMNVDTYDKLFYPTKGYKVELELKYSTVRKWMNDINVDNTSLILKYGDAQSPLEKLTFIENLQLGFSFGDSIVLPNHYMLGGLGEFDNFLPFVGLNMGELTGSKVASYQMDMQWQLYKNHYLLFRGGVGKVAETMEQMLNFDNLVFGYGLTYGFNSVIGPIELTVMSATENHKIIPFFNIGVWF